MLWCSACARHCLSHGEGTESEFSSRETAFEKAHSDGVVSAICCFKKIVFRPCGKESRTHRVICMRLMKRSCLGCCVYFSLTYSLWFVFLISFASGGSNRDSGGVIHAEEGNYLLSRC